MKTTLHFYLVLPWFMPQLLQILPSQFLILNLPPLQFVLHTTTVWISFLKHKADQTTSQLKMIKCFPLSFKIKSKGLNGIQGSSSYHLWLPFKHYLSFIHRLYALTVLNSWDEYALLFPSLVLFLCFLSLSVMPPHSPTPSFSLSVCYLVLSLQN